MRKKTNKTNVVAGVVFVSLGALIGILALTGGNDVSEESGLDDGSADTTLEGRGLEAVPETPVNTSIPPQPNGNPSAGSGAGNEVSVRQVVYTEAGFSPFLSEVEAGEEVTFINRSNKGLWVTANMHPTAGDQKYSAFDSGRTLAPGERFTFAFVQIGTWGYKNLNNENHLGAVVVTPQQ